MRPRPPLPRLLRFGLQYLAGWELSGVGLNLTRRCNLRCAYCKAMDNSPERRARELSPAHWRQIIDRLADHRRAHFIFTGGEPLLYRGVFELIDHAARRALTSLITNATLLDEAAFARLENLDFLTFSCDTLGRTAGGHPKDPRPHLARIAAGCRAARITPSAIVTVTAQNLDEVEPLVHLLHQQRVSALISLIHSGEGGFDFRPHAPELTFADEESRRRLGDLGRRLVALKREGVSVAESDHFLLNMERHARGDYRLRCPAADPFLTVDIDGRIKACHDTPASEQNALTFTDYPTMLRAVRATVPEGCTCYYDCYVEGKNSRAQNLGRLLRRFARGR